MSLLSLENVIKQEDNRTILKNINLEIKRNEQIGIKMSSEESVMLFNLISGIYPPTSGQIQVEADRLQSEHKDDGLYDSLTVQSYLHYFKKIANFPYGLEDYIASFSLMDVWQIKIRKLTEDQRKRVSLFRMFLFSPDLMLIENPLHNQTSEGIELYLKALDQLRSNGMATLFTSNSMEELLLLSSEVYRYNPLTGLEKTDIAFEEDPEMKEKQEDEKSFKPNNVFKVTCKLADKTIFFSPDEIDYIESVNSVSNIRIDEEYFPTELTMSVLEEKLSKFGFFRCHRSYLVNLQRVSELISYSKNSYTLILKGNPHSKLPLSRNRLEEMRQLIEF